MEKGVRHIIEEIAVEAPILAGLKESDPMVVPNGYFDHLPSRLSNAVLQQGVVTKEVKPKKGTEMSVPEGFFDTMKADILKKVGIGQNDVEEDPLTDAPILKSLKNQNPFKVPEQYFDDQPATLKVSIVPRRRKGLSIVWKRLSMATAAAVLIVLVGIAFFQTEQHSGATDCHGELAFLCGFSQLELESIIQNNIEDFDEDVLEENMTEESIERLIDDGGALLNEEEALEGIDELELDEFSDEDWSQIEDII